MSAPEGWPEPGTSNPDGYNTDCFPYDTLIDTPRGKVKIGELQKGQMILSYDGCNLVPRMITRKRIRGIAPILRAGFDTGKVLRAASHHTFLTTASWKKFANILCGDELIQADSTHSVVESLLTQKAEPVFNIYTAGEHNFIADGFVAHNFTEFRAIRTILHRMFLDPVTQLEVVLN